MLRRCLRRSITNDERLDAVPCRREWKTAACNFYPVRTNSARCRHHYLEIPDHLDPHLQRTVHIELDRSDDAYRQLRRCRLGRFKRTADGRPLEWPLLFPGRTASLLELRC